MAEWKIKRGEYIIPKRLVIELGKPILERLRNG